MCLKFKNLIGVLALATTATSFHSAAMAQSSLVTRLRGGNETISETFNRAFFKNDPEFFRNRSAKRQLDFLFGPGSLLRNSFPENEIRRDAELVDILYRDILNQQVSSDPIIRTPDLPNPYETSILTSPRINVNNQVEERESIEPTEITEPMLETQPPQ
jgi:hypothetical protein